MTTTTTNMGLLQAQGSDNARDYLKTFLANSLGLVDTHDHSSSKGLPVKRLANGTFASRPAFGNAGHVYVATDSNRVTWDNGTAWIEAVMNGTTQAVTLAGGLQITAANVGVGPVGPSPQTGVSVTSTLSGSTSVFGLLAQPIASSSATLEVDGIASQPSTAASAFTMTNATAFHAFSVVKGAGSVITTSYGLLVDPITSGNTNNYGVYIGVPSGGSGTNLGLSNQGGSVVNGAGTSLDFFGGTSRNGKQPIVGSRAGNAALQSLIQALAAYGLVTDSTTA